MLVGQLRRCINDVETGGITTETRALLLDVLVGAVSVLEDRGALRAGEKLTDWETELLADEDAGVPSMSMAYSNMAGRTLMAALIIKASDLTVASRQYSEIVGSCALKPKNLKAAMGAGTIQCRRVKTSDGDEYRMSVKLRRKDEER
jgi:hypothetical protein